ncbi:MAG: condensation domain-containing protein, partial [Gemmatimonadales bacterium]
MSEPATPKTLEFSSDDLGLLQQLLAEAGVTAPPPLAEIPRRGDVSHAPLSYAQELLWLLDRASPGMTAYNIPVASRLSGPLDLTALELALTDVTTRHEALRTRFVTVAGESAQRIDPPAAAALAVIDLRDLEATAREAEVTRILRERVGVAFD